MPRSVVRPTLRWMVTAALMGALLANPAPTSASTSHGPGSAEAPGRRTTFSDDDGTPYERAIEVLAADGIVTGCDDGGDRYCPRDPVRRGQVATLLVRAFDLPDARSDHVDGDDGSAHERDIDRLAAVGISLDCEGDDACAARTLRRGQMAALLVRAAKVDRATATYFRDTAGDPHRRAVDRLAAAGITAGCSTSPARFCPRGRVLRGELAVFLARALHELPRAELAPVRTAKVAPRAAPKERRGAAERRGPERRRTGTTVWDRLARCESGGNWSINTGNGYYGGLQFSLGSWRAVGGSGYPHTASRREQIERGKRLKARQGWGAWPSCAGRIGLR